VFAGFLIRIKCDPKKILPNYLFQYTKTKSYWDWVKIMSMRSGQPGINGKEYTELPLLLPKIINEQHAIAEALSNMDSLIAAQEALIAKKRAIKLGVMQELLTGKRRLPGFSGEWKCRKLTEICWFQEGPGVRTTQFTRSGVKLFNGSNIQNGRINLDNTDRYISEKEAFGPYSHFLADEGDLVIASSGVTIDKFEEKVAFIEKEHLPLCMNTSTIRFKPNKDHLQPYFLLNFLMSDSFKQQIGSIATGSAQLNFGPAHIIKVRIDVPDMEEQIAIVEILTDLSEQILILEEKLQKTKFLKQGMMQELLTGRIRLTGE
jgi:type I restriction enzyme S subunit